MSTYNTFKSKFDQKKSKHPDAIFLFRLGDFYEIYLKDAALCADLLGISLRQRKLDDRFLPVAWFPHHALDIYLPRLIRAGQRVAICDPIEVEREEPAEVVIPYSQK